MVPYVKLSSSCLNESSQLSKNGLKDISKPENCGSSVKVNSISDGIHWNFMWQNATNVYYTSKKLSSICRIWYSLMFWMADVAFSEVLNGWYCNNNVNSKTETCGNLRQLGEGSSAPPSTQ